MGVIVMSVDYRIIGQRIKQMRKTLRQTQEHLAEQLDVTVGYISQVERGVTKANLDLLCRISDLFGCDVSYFVTGISAAQDTYLLDEFTELFMHLSKDQKRFVVSLMEMQLAKDSQEKTK